ncbi:MAG: hypothetical protein OWU84_04480 [Firmicutes bacterium]|nr:hypothetical protein [Bacillota bacterium]
MILLGEMAGQSQALPRPWMHTCEGEHGGCGQVAVTRVDTATAERPDCFPTMCDTAANGNVCASSVDDILRHLGWARYRKEILPCLKKTSRAAWAVFVDNLAMARMTGRLNNGIVSLLPAATFLMSARTRFWLNGKGQ